MSSSMTITVHRFPQQLDLVKEGSVLLCVCAISLMEADSSGGFESPPAAPQELLRYSVIRVYTSEAMIEDAEDSGKRDFPNLKASANVAEEVNDEIVCRNANAASTYRIKNEDVQENRLTVDKSPCDMLQITSEARSNANRGFRNLVMDWWRFSHGPCQLKSTHICDINCKDMSEQIADAVANLKAHLGKCVNGSYPRGPANLDSWGIHRSLRLRGGAGAAADTNSSGGGWGNSGGSNGSTAVGNPPSWNQPPPNVPAGQQPSNPSWGQQSNESGDASGNSVGSGAPPANGSGTSWAQAAGKGLPNNTQGNSNSPGTSANGNGGPGSGPSHASGSVPNGSSTLSGSSNDSQQQKRELEKIREALYATDGWGGKNVNQDSEWIVPPSPPRSPTSENPSSWKATNNSTGTELWENNIRNGGVSHRIPEIPNSTVKPPWGRYGNSNEFGGQWDPDDENGEPGQSWTAPPPNQWGSGVNAGQSSASGMWQAGKDKSNVDWSNPGTSNSGPAWDPRGPNTNRWGNSLPGPVGSMGKPSGGPGVPAGGSWGAKSGWGDEGAASGKGGDDGTALWGDASAPGGMRKKEGMMGRGMPGSAGVRMPPGGRPPGHRGWGDEGPVAPDPAGTSNWGLPPSSPPHLGGPAGWGQKPKPSGMGWGESSDMLDSSGGNWAGHKQGKMMGKDLWKQPYGGYNKDDSGAMGGGRSMEEMPEVGHSYGSHRNDPANMDPSGVGMGVQPSSAGPGGWPPSNLGGGMRMDEHHHGHHGGGFGGNNPYESGMMPGAVGGGMGRVPGSGFSGQSQPNLPQYMQGRGSGGPGIPGAGAGIGSSSVGSGVRQGQPSSQQLQLLVHQIHAAVQSGHLNPQILNQKLSSTTLVLLHDLLNQIKILQGLMSQQMQYQQGQVRGLPPNAVMQVSVKITQTKQQIQNLQNQINAQQGIFTKSGGPHLGGPSAMMMDSNMTGGSGFQKFGQGPGAAGFGSAVGQDPMFSSMMGSMNLNASGILMGSGVGMGSHTNPGDVAGVGVVDYQQHTSGMQSSSSRFFNDWRAGDANKRDDGSAGLGYSGAGMLGGAVDGTWATTNMKVETGGWPDSAMGGVPGSQVGWSSGGGVGSSVGSSHYNISDLPEFEPGKPWKGNQLLKNIEDDPTITPGSVKRNPFSVAAIKEPDLGMKTPLTSSESAATSTSTGSKPGSGSGSAVVSTSGAPGFGTSTWSYSSGRNTWLVLNNLSPGMDSSTLKTLCMQHGPLNAFHVMSHQGVALVRYSSYDEASKAQASLHNCILGSATIRADFASDSDVQSFLGNSSVQQSAGGGQGMQTSQNQMQQLNSSATWSSASMTSQGSAKTHETSWAQSGMNSWSGGGGNASSLWDSADQSHSYLPDNLI
ncbi:unnamed protein product [Notodromas monacha]|uniref:RRM domain-containing protein n=1 Tax=Notodromas monacha TaxID=399045 RepID=A0A7R9GBD3_9CRUS|nr:unnamed protein product [Notodromas monacha]CAG0916381.1 unnamed protein product [Notodromas monacha]